MATKSKKATAPPPVAPVIPRFVPGEIIVRLKPGGIPNKLPVNPIQIAKLINLAEFLKRLRKLDQRYDLVSVQPLIRDGHWFLDTLLPALCGLLLGGSLAGFRNRLAELLANGRQLSFPQDFLGGVRAQAPWGLPSAARLKEMFSWLLLRFRNSPSEVDLNAIIQALQSLEIVAFAEMVPLRYVPPVPSYGERRPDPQPPVQGPVPMAVPYGELWGREVVDAGQVLIKLERPTARRVAMLDTGVDLTHPLLQDGRVESGFTNWIWDKQGHGTHVCGVLNAATGYHPNAPAAPVIRGLLPAGSKVVSFKVVDNELSAWGFYPVNPSYYVSALEDIVNNGGIDAVNISMGGEAPLSSTEDYWLAKVAALCPIVAAAGNHPKSGDVQSVLYPAASSYAYAVGAAVHRPNWGPSRVDVWEYSNTGLGSSDCIAPGFNIYSTMPTYPPPDAPNRTYVMNRAWMEGSSMAAPFVTAMRAMQLSLNYEMPTVQSRTVGEVGRGLMVVA